MNQGIDPYLRSIEYEYGIQIIGAWDRGSRAWGLNTAESDYDIRLCFTQPYSNYIMSSEYIQSIKSDGTTLSSLSEDIKIEPEKIEFQGWDIRRFIELLANNNPSIFECLASSLTYQSHPIFEEISEYALDRIHPIELWNHYQSAAKNLYYTYIDSGTDTSAKRTLFIFRNMLCGEYIRYTHEFPIIDYPQLLQKAPDECFEFISRDTHQELMEMKRGGQKEREIGNKYSEEISAYLNCEIQYQEHIPDQTIQTDDLDSYVENLIHSTTMFL